MPVILTVYVYGCSFDRVSMAAVFTVCVYSSGFDVEMNFRRLRGGRLMSDTRLYSEGVGVWPWFCCMAAGFDTV